jgi:hypothetical protein
MLAGFVAPDVTLVCNASRLPPVPPVRAIFNLLYRGYRG